MSTGDDPPKKPPRASWETPDPDDAAPVGKSESKSKPTATWTPPPVEEPPPRKKATRAETKPPRASWEAPDPDETAKSGSTTVSGSWNAQPEPSVVVSDEPRRASDASVVSDEPRLAPVAASVVSDETRRQNPVTTASVAVTETPSASAEAPSSTPPYESGTYQQAGLYEQPAPGAYEPSAGYEQPTSGAYDQPASTSGAYEAPTASGGYVSDAQSGSVPTTSGSYAAQTASGSYASSSGSSGGTSGTESGAVRSSDSDDPLAPLPTVAEDNTLRSAVGAKLVKEPRKKPPPPPDFDDDDDDDGDGPKRPGRGMYIAIFASLVGVLGLGIAALVIFGNMNKQKFMITCEPQEVHAKQGRGFPPWGERSIDDEGMWKPIKIPPEAECRERETEDQEELSRWYLDILVDRASSLLTAREVTKIDDAAAMLEQALLHARSPDRREQRRDIERLLGDVGYWRASAKLKDASTALTDAAKQFDAAAAQRPRHVSDASAWATYVRKLVEELRAGPNGVSTSFPPTPPVVPGREPAPPGVALPVEPGAGSSSEPPPAPPDAGLPTGGVLL